LFIFVSTLHFLFCEKDFLLLKQQEYNRSSIELEYQQDLIQAKFETAPEYDQSLPTHGFNGPPQQMIYSIFVFNGLPPSLLLVRKRCRDGAVLWRAASSEPRRRQPLAHVLPPRTIVILSVFLF
jgi:hypothetical protein